MGDGRVFTCTERGEEVSSDLHGTPKIFKLHVKREHKRELQTYEKSDSIDRPYWEFLSDDDIQQIREDDVWM